MDSDPPNRVKALIVSTWGNPRGWFRAGYVFDPGLIAHEGFRGYLRSLHGGGSFQSGVCTCRSSTLALASLLYELNLVSELKVIIFGLDTLADPSACVEDLKECAKQQYKQYLREYLRECSCCGKLYKLYEEVGDKIIEVVVTPGVGKFHNFTFRASPRHVFINAFTKVLNTIENWGGMSKGSRPNFVFVDITHGINYQVVAVLMAVLAVATLFRMENRVVMYNSEPATPPRQFRGSSKEKEEDKEIELGLLEVSDIVSALRFAEAVAEITRFRSTLITQFLRREQKKDVLGSGIQEKIKRAAIFVKLIENSAIGLTYPGAVNEDGNELGYSICVDAELGEETCREIDFERYVDVDKREIRYKDADMSSVLTCVFEKVVSNLRNELCRESSNGLTRYIKAIEERLDREGLIQARLIALKEYNAWVKLEEIVNKIAKNCSNLIKQVDKYAKELKNIGVKAGMNIEKDVIEVEQELIKILLTEIPTKMVYVDDEDVKCEDMGQLILNNLKNLKEESAKKLEKIDDDTARNILAHAGLSHTLITKAVFSKTRDRNEEKFKIHRIVFDKKLVEEFIKKYIER